MQTVASTSYPTGATTSTIATTNHPKVLCIGKDLEAKCRGGFDRTVTLTADMIPTATGSFVTFINDFVDKQYGTDQTAADGETVVPGAAHKIPFYNFCHWFIYQPNYAQAKARNFFQDDGGTPPTITTNNAPGFEYFQNYITEINSNDTTWDHVDRMSYKFENAPIGAQYPQIEILTDSNSQSTGNAVYYNAKRNITGMAINGNTAITESIVPSTRSTIPIVTYKTAPMEQGSYFVRGDKAGKPSRQPTYHIGMRAIDKLDPTMTSTRASTFVQANIEFEITATMIVNLPSYPNRFVKPKFYNTSIENAVQGIGAYPAFIDRYATFGLLNESANAPAVSAIDQQAEEATEDNLVIKPQRLRPRRSLPSIAKIVRVKK
jgi:hypothetical protein